MRFNVNYEEQLKDSAKFFCSFIGAPEEMFKIEYLGSCTSITFGDSRNPEIGLQVYAGVFSDGTADRVIMSAGRGLYYESREQQVLDHFLYQDAAFFDWMEEAMAKIEMQDMRRAKAKKKSKEEIKW